MNEPLFQTVADRVREDLLAPGIAAGLPSIEELARLYHVSYMTMWKAFDLLAKEGAIDRHQGRRSWAPAPEIGPRRKGAGSAPASAETLRKRIAGDIANGVYHTGEPLPKIGWFTSTHRVSRNTVMHVISDLCEQGLIHKQGRQWMVGPPPHGASGRSRQTAGPVVVLNLPDEFSRVVMFTSAHYAPFVSALRTEFLKHRTALTVVLRDRPPQESAALRWGIETARSYLRELGGRYLGGLIVDTDPQREQFVEWARALSDDGDRPAVYFDSTGARENLDRASLSLGESYVRCFMDETAGLKLALRHLAEHGHRIVAFPVFSPANQGFAPLRLALLRKIVEEVSPRMELLSVEMKEPFWDTGLLAYDPVNTVSFNDRLQKHAESGHSGQTGSVRRRVLRSTESLYSLLKQGVTALIAMNDRAAYQFMWWSAAAGIEIPRDLSLVAFDNNAESETLPLSSVDFGFARLGYLAAHALIGDIPVRTDRRGNIPSECTLVDRGSVGAPADPARIKALLS